MRPTDMTREYIDAWNARDPARVAGTLSEGGTYEDPITGGPLGKEALAEYAAGLFASFPDLDFELASNGESGPGHVVLAWTMRGTNRGALRGLPATGCRIALPGVDLITVGERGIERVQGFFDRQTMMDQLGLHVVTQPHAVGPVRFGVCTQVRSKSQAPPGAVALTMIDARSDDEVQHIRDASRRIMMGLVGMPGFLSFQGAVVGRRLTTVTLWESREAMRQVMREENHKQASGEMLAGVVGGAFHASTWSLERMGDLWVRCEECGGLWDARATTACRCGARVEERPAYW